MSTPRHSGYSHVGCGGYVVDDGVSVGWRCAYCYADFGPTETLSSLQIKGYIEPTKPQEPRYRLVERVSGGKAHYALEPIP